ncbi:MAG: acetate--CoA ligase family protein, partial [Gammaproteobacteria bacterium]
MNLHEYQSKAIFRNHGIPVPEGIPVTDAQQARTAAASLGGDRWVVKAQVHAGGRGKAGGVVLTDNVEQTVAEAGRMLGSELVTPQTGDSGLPINQVLVEKPTAIARELYMGALVDRAAKRIAFMVSGAGGMNIEEVAAATPEKIVTIHV